jgi:WD40-like Beta Propeller Repeat
VGVQRRALVALVVASLLSPLAGCRRVSESLGVRVAPRELRDVPAARLAFRLEPDRTEQVPDSIKNETQDVPMASVRAQFESSRKDEALLRTVASPDGQRVLALYAPNDPTFPQDEFKIDLYNSAGVFLRNVLPQDLSGVFMSSVSWSPDGQLIVFAGRRTAKPQPSPTATPPPGETPLPEVTDPNAPPTPAPTVAPLIAPVATYRTEQLYLCDGYGTNLHTLTAREGLIYFHAAWSPDGHALAALACKEEELAARINENKPLAGRPRIIERDGRERLLSDQLMDALPVWSPDGTKVATAADTDVAIFDAAADKPTAALLPLRDPLLAASATYDAEHLQRATPVNAAAQKNGQAAQPTPQQPAQSTGTPLSFNPVIRLEWIAPETLLVETGYVRIFQSESEPTRRYLRWHVLHLSPQAVVLQ